MENAVLRVFASRVSSYLSSVLRGMPRQSSSARNGFKDGSVADRAASPFCRALEDLLKNPTSDEQSTLACMASRRGSLGWKNPTDGPPSWRPGSHMTHHLIQFLQHSGRSCPRHGMPCAWPSTSLSTSCLILCRSAVSSFGTLTTLETTALVAASHRFGIREAMDIERISPAAKIERADGRALIRPRDSLRHQGLTCLHFPIVTEFCLHVCASAWPWASLALACALASPRRWIRGRPRALLCKAWRLCAT